MRITVTVPGTRSGRDIELTLAATDSGELAVHVPTSNRATHVDFTVKIDDLRAAVDHLAPSTPPPTAAATPPPVAAHAEA